MKRSNKKIILESGHEFFGYGFGADREAVCDLVFNTAMVGYQEMLSDPSYTDQMVVLTYPLVGNYGVTDEDYETKFPTLGGLVVREYNDMPSNFRYTKTLGEVCEEYGIPGIWGLDTRMLTRLLRREGSQRALITDASTTKEEALQKIKQTPRRTDAVARVSCRKRWFSRTANHRFDVVAVDCGIKHNIIRELNKRGCNVTVVPCDTTAEEILAFRPDGVFFSNGPGDPADVPQVIETVRALRGKLPIFGICLGCQIIALAYGAKTRKIDGHRGNYPVRCLETGRIEMTSQNHGYAIDADSLTGTGLALTHVNLLDGTTEGVECRDEHTFCVQYHPEGAPGPQDSLYLFDRFIEIMENHA